MGCDIHPYWEVKTSPDKPWQSLFPMEKNKYYDAEEAAEAAKNGETYWEPEYSIPSPDYDGPFYIGRNYSLFALLAGVRDHGETIPLSEPRGLPSDVSPEIFQVSERWDCDGHSHSYFNMLELDAVNWETSTCKQRGIVSEEVYVRWTFGGDPYPNCQGVGGVKVKVVERESLDAILAGKVKREPRINYYTWIEWELKIMEFSTHFINVINNVKEKAEKDFGVTDPKNIRFVFFFDN